MVEKNRESSFISRHEATYKHIYKAVEIHENSRYHQSFITAALQLCKEEDIESYLNRSQAKYREKQIETRRKLLQRLIDITLFIGRHGFANRENEETSYSLGQTGNHGNFLELVLLISEYDVILKTHVEQFVEESRKKQIKELQKSKKSKSKKAYFWRGSLVTFLSKTFINKLITTIGKIGKQMILKDLSDSKIILMKRSISMFAVKKSFIVIKQAKVIY